MTNEDIRMKIAAIKGWTFVDAKKFIGARDKSGLCAFEECPNWPVNIADAWELVEEMYNYNIKKIGGVTTAVLYPDTHILRGQVGKADTAPLAICLAYIGVKESHNA